MKKNRSDRFFFTVKAILTCQAKGHLIALRYSEGLTPFFFKNTSAKYDGLENPHAKAISAMLLSDERSISLAFSIRLPRRYSLSVIPVLLLNRVLR